MGIISKTLNGCVCVCVCVRACVRARVCVWACARVAGRQECPKVTLCASVSAFSLFCAQVSLMNCDFRSSLRVSIPSRVSLSSVCWKGKHSHNQLRNWNRKKYRFLHNVLWCIHLHNNIRIQGHTNTDTHRQTDRQTHTHSHTQGPNDLLASHNWTSTWEDQTPTLSLSSDIAQLPVKSDTPPPPPQKGIKNERTKVSNNHIRFSYLDDELNAGHKHHSVQG